jgi:flagellar hook-length control protein FliK
VEPVQTGAEQQQIQGTPSAEAQNAAPAPQEAPAGVVAGSESPRRAAQAGGDPPGAGRAAARIAAASARTEGELRREGSRVPAAGSAAGSSQAPQARDEPADASLEDASAGSGEQAATSASAPSGEVTTALAPSVESVARSPDPESPTVTVGGVELENMIDSIRATVQMAARGGASHARISLQPEELGEIRIHLTQTRDGLLARVSAGSTDAARILMAGRSELADSLRSLGTALLGLEIETSSQSHTRGEDSRPASSDSEIRGEDSESEAEQTEAVEGSAERPASPRGALVDVLA